MLGIVPVLRNSGETIFTSLSSFCISLLPRGSNLWAKPFLPANPKSPKTIPGTTLPTTPSLSLSMSFGSIFPLLHLAVQILVTDVRVSIALSRVRVVNSNRQDEASASLLLVASSKAISSALALFPPLKTAASSDLSLGLSISLELAVSWPAQCMTCLRRAMRSFTTFSLCFLLAPAPTSFTNMLMSDLSPSTLGSSGDIVASGISIWKICELGTRYMVISSEAILSRSGSRRKNLAASSPEGGLVIMLLLSILLSSSSSTSISLILPTSSSSSFLSSDSPSLLRPCQIGQPISLSRREMISP
mmetsp:Transcript_22660/g.47067  ORF Transcript_22660/g.47067 Transcript_22660/m.47067 type:complete len:303 (-) Transcript_22660:3960-4868(-)